MANAHIPRAQVHEWSERIGDDPEAHQAALTRLLKGQRRISKFVEENAQSMQPQTGGVALYLIGVILRMFDLGGGRLRSATWEQVRNAEQRIGGHVGNILPLGDGFLERARSVPRAQAHILDEALLSLFMRAKADEEEDLDEGEAFKVYCLMWVATEALDANWRPAKDFAGEVDYAYVHIEPTPRDDDQAAADPEPAAEAEVEA